jgi:hypothetical protein
MSSVCVCHREYTATAYACSHCLTVQCRPIKNHLKICEKDWKKKENEKKTNQRGNFDKVAEKIEQDSFKELASIQVDSEERCKGCNRLIIN